MPFAIRIRQHGGTDVLVPEEISAIEPGPGEAVVSQSHVGVNYLDVYHRTGLYPNPLPLTPGIEGAGIVTKLGADVIGIAIGDRVAYAGVLGGYSTERTIPAARLVPLPEDVSELQAAAAMVCGITAEYLIHRTYRVQRGDWVLFHAAAGGVGTIAVQWLASMGARVIATAGTEEKRTRALALGAEHVIDYNETDWPAQVRDHTQGAGVAVAFDGVGLSTFQGSIDALRTRGTLVLFGNASGAVPPIDPLLLSSKGSLYITRPTLAHYIASRSELLGAADALFGAMRSGAVQLASPTVFPLTDAAAAHAFIESRRSTGSIVLRT